MYNFFLKRIIDFIFSLFLLLFFSWLILLVGSIYIFTFQTPVFFIQERTGFREQRFSLIKFRTLNSSALPLSKRKFWLGDILRFTSFDELPQLWNVLKGEMSLIGPRPLPIEYLPMMNSLQRKRYVVRPGITGWAQVNGRSTIPWNRKFELDAYYVDNISFKLDLIILIKTFTLLLSFRKDVSLTEKKFDGN